VNELDRLFICRLFLTMDVMIELMNTLLSIILKGSLFYWYK